MFGEGHRDYLPEHANQAGLVGAAPAEQVEVLGGPVRAPHPDREERGALQHEVIDMVRHRQPVQQALDGVAHQQALLAFAVAARTREEAIPHRDRVVLLFHDRLSK
jgi:mannitol/fructose-specific phosphotransferase system IIA component